MIRLLRLFIVAIFILLQLSPAFAQQNVESGKMNLTQEFKRAQKMAFEGNREEARLICAAILKENPKYYDARILRGRTLAWDKKYEESRKELLIVLEDDFDNRDAVLALIDLEKWSGDLSKALFYCDYGQSFYPREEKFLIQKIKLQQQSGLEDKSLQTINDLLEINPGSEEGNELFKKYTSAFSKYTVSLKHDFEHFSEPYVRRWHITSLQLSKRNSWGSLIGRVNFGDLVSDGEGLWSKDVAKQFEVDAYPRTTATAYMYLSYGYSPDNLFPQHRAGAEWYQKLPNKFEASAGLRFMRFNGSSGAKNVFIYTGSLGKYYRNYWFSLRGYFTPKNSDVSRSFIFTTRRYLRDAKQYVGIELGTGTSPDEARGNVSDFSTYKYDSWKVKLSYQDQLLDKRLTYLLRAGFEKEEYQVNEKRNILSFSIKLSYNL